MQRSMSSLPIDQTPVLFSPTFTVVNEGPAAVRAIVSGADKIAVRKRVQALAELLNLSDYPGYRRLLPTNDSIRVEFDPTLIEASAVKRMLRMMDASAPGRPE